jgi:hypothetical protein
VVSVPRGSLGSGPERTMADAVNHGATFTGEEKCPISPACAISALGAHVLPYPKPAETCRHRSWNNPHSKIGTTSV